jgi:hypothetical protein
MTGNTYHTELAMRAAGSQQVPAFYGFLRTLLKAATRPTHD